MGYPEAQYVIDELTSQIDEVKNQTSGLLNTHGFAEFATAGTHEWTCPEGVESIYFLAVGGSGGGGGGGGGAEKSNSNYYATKATGGGSGAAGGVTSGLIEVESGKTYIITVGEAGSAGSAGAKVTTGYEGKNGGNGGNGGDTKLGDVILAKGGGGGKGGAGSHEGGTDADAVSNKSGGAGGAVVDLAVSAVTFVLEQVIAGKAGTKCDKFYTTNSPDYYAGTAGGAAVTNSYGRSSGAGGKGGTMHETASSITAGSKGGAGSAGYLKIIW